MKKPFDSLSKSGRKVVLLMHDRLFRKGKLDKNNEESKSDKSELKKLSELIDYFKLINAEFKSLDTY